ncbi:MAG: hypothetical protein HN368_02455 [Spirochaetales bacterium]|nr:hypothetical protein [Spirochaetales bacterium]
MFWNIDDTDVDLHVRENVFSRVWYQRTESRSGGRLLWDNTDGLGPEMYVHPTLSYSGYKVFVDYFSSSSVEGAAPAATLVTSFSRIPQSTMYRTRWYAKILESVSSEMIEIMPTWKRIR